MSSRYSRLNGAAIGGTLPLASAFARASATVNADGSACAANTVRQSATRLLVDSPTFTKDIASASNMRCADAGLAADGTPIRAIYFASNVELRIYVGDDYPTATTTIDCTRADDGDEDFAANLSGVARKDNIRYVPKSLRIRCGLTVVACRRDLDTNANPASRAWSARGVSVFLSSDNGATWAIWQHETDGDDPVGETAANGLDRGNSWMLSISPLGHAQGEAWTSVGVSVNDYQIGGSRDGFQIFWGRATRPSSVSATWTPEDMMTVASATGLNIATHSHSAWSILDDTTLYVISSGGDNYGQQVIHSYSFPIADYLDSPTITRTLLHGGHSGLGDAALPGFQGVNFEQGPYDNSMILGGDDANNGPSLVEFDPSGPSITVTRLWGMTACGGGEFNSLRLTCADPVSRQHYFASYWPTPTYSGADGKLAGRLLYSPDGLVWAPILTRASTVSDAYPGTVMSDGERVFVLNGPNVGDGVYSAPMPNYRTQRFAQLGRGTTNYADGDFATVGVGSGNTVTQQSRSGGLVVNPVTAEVFAEQPPALGIVYRVQFGGSNVSAGRVRFDSSQSAPSGRVHYRIWVRSLGPYALKLQHRAQGFDGTTTRTGALKNIEIAAGGWTAITGTDDLSAATANMIPEILLSQFNACVQDMIVVMDYWVAGTGMPCYPLPVGAASPDSETLAYTLPAFPTPTYAVAFALPDDAWDASRASADGASCPIFCAYTDANNYIEARYSITNQRIEVEAVAGGSTLGTATMTSFPIRGDVVKLAVYLDGTGLTCKAIVGGQATLSATLSAANSLTPATLYLNRDAAGTTIGNNEFARVEVHDTDQTATVSALGAIGPTALRDGVTPGLSLGGSGIMAIGA